MMIDSLTPPLVLDHVLCWTELGATQAVSALENVGLRFDAEIAKHDGQGTASRFVTFENLYLELLWIEDPRVAGHNFRERAAWRRNGASPFGFAFRRTHPDVELPFHTWEHRASWMGQDRAIDVASSASELHEPLIFVVPPGLSKAPPEARPLAPPDGLHPVLGVKRVTSMRLILPPQLEPSATLDFLTTCGALTTVRGQDSILDLTLDDRPRARTIDLRPTLPILLRC